jgi:hypothetical protein
MTAEPRARRLCAPLGGLWRSGGTQPAQTAAPACAGFLGRSSEVLA